jgi:hypothetical protein
VLVRCKGGSKGLTVVEGVDVSWKISEQLRLAVGGGGDEQLVVHHDAAVPAIPSETTSSDLTSSGLG